MSECTHDCSTCSEHCGERKAESMREPANALSHVGHVIAVVSGKGGVGKSLVTSMLAVEMQRRGYITAILDADITGPSIPKSFGIAGGQVEGSDQGMFPPRSKTGVEVMSLNLLMDDEEKPVVWRGPVIAGAVKQFWTDVVWGDVDYMFVDMPPGTGDVPLTVFQSLPVDGIIIVASPQELVGMIVEKAVKMAEMMDVPVLGLVENMAYITCPDCDRKLYPFGEGKTAMVAAAHGLPLLAQLPILPDLARACDEGKIESMDFPWMGIAADAVEKCEVREHN